MAADIITSQNFFERIGSPAERPDDRRIWSAMEMWQWQADWAAARARDDWQGIEALERRYDQITCL